ncbi:protease inhibitor I9 family protein [Neobacillus sp. YX16]|uniref:protease inhibitor I9 family protein n=1 Tax=Neobacillus sp. YX16 TaxID=3047874 RepID=UPI0024C3F02C|nr:protease inhibitor I9 family protein [Neobacillus sp. YX16]WHZ03822.1 protease inhibitor I9 family protein [Neobacillus sp. YX16]
MRKYYRVAILAIAFLFILSGCQERNQNVDEEKEVKETMNPSVQIDPEIDLSSEQMTSIIIEFKTKPAKIAVLEAEAKGIPLTIEEAKEKVEESHATFQKELESLLDKNQVPYKVRNTYKTALNGVSMEIPANEIIRLAEASSVISKIHPNKKIQLNPPISPSDQK